MPSHNPELHGGRKKNEASQVCRTLHCRSLSQQTPLERQISRGRPDTKLNWCGQSVCFAECYIFEPPVRYYVRRVASKHGFLVISYHKDFVKAVVETVFPNLIEFTAKAAKLRAILSFVDSPPIRAAFWRCMTWCYDHELELTPKALQMNLIKVINTFQNLMFGDMTKERVDWAHEFLQPRLSKEIDRFEHILIQFLIRAELWRRHQTCRLVAWDMGTPRQVSEFLTAMVYHYWLMHCDDCFEEQEMDKKGSWDIVWEEWLDEYPVTESHDVGDENGEVLAIREELEGTEEEILERVGYLGGIGQGDEVCKLARLINTRK